MIQLLAHAGRVLHAGAGAPFHSSPASARLLNVSAMLSRDAAIGGWGERAARSRPADLIRDI